MHCIALQSWATSAKQGTDDELSWVVSPYKPLSGKCSDHQISQPADVYEPSRDIQHLRMSPFGSLRDPWHTEESETSIWARILLIFPRLSSSSPGRVPCPPLTTLDTSVRRHDLWRFLDLLGTRAAAGSRLETLRLLRLQVPPADIQLLNRRIDALRLLHEHKRSRRMESPKVRPEKDGDRRQP